MSKYWLQLKAPAGNWYDSLGTDDFTTAWEHGIYLQSKGETARVVERKDKPVTALGNSQFRKTRSNIIKNPRSRVSKQIVEVAQQAGMLGWHVFVDGMYDTDISPSDTAQEALRKAMREYPRTGQYKNLDYSYYTETTTNPRPRIGNKKPLRASSATGKRPTKRLVSRRKSNTRKGYFPNPSIREMKTLYEAGLGKSDAHLKLRRKLPRMTKAEHLEKAYAFILKADNLNQDWALAQESAHIETFGKPPQIHDYIISSIGRNEYTTAAKNKLRGLAHATTRYRNAAYLHWKAAGKRGRLPEQVEVETKFHDELKRESEAAHKFHRSLSRSNNPTVTKIPGFYDEKGNLARVGLKVKDFRGDAATVKGFEPPHKPESEGFITTNLGRHYAGVYGFKWQGPRPYSRNPTRRAIRQGIRFYRKHAGKWLMFDPAVYAAKTKSDAIKIAGNLAKMFKTQIKVVLQK